jgi:hypothetical protein
VEIVVNRLTQGKVSEEVLDFEHLFAKEEEKLKQLELERQH